MAGHSRPKDGVASARLRPAIPLSSKELSPVMDTRVKPAYDESRLLFLGEFRRRFAGNLPEGVGKSRDAGIADGAGELLARDIGIRRQALAALFAAEPGHVEIERPHLDIGEHVDRMFEQSRDPGGPIRRHQPAALRRRGLHRALGGIDQLRPAVHVGVEPDALFIAARNQMDAIAGGALAPQKGSDWRFGDSHWRHPVRTRIYNLFQDLKRIRPGNLTMNSPSRVIGFVNAAHFIDHYAMLIFAAAVIVMGPALGMAYSELLPYATPGFIAFGAGSLITGWLGDRWSRRHMMVIFFAGIGASMIAVGFVQTPLQLGAALLSIGLFASIYPPLGTAMIVSYAAKLRREIGLNGVWGDLGVASSALLSALIRPDL